MAGADYFPNLVSSGYRKTSEETETYNCLAWAVGVNDVWWDIADGYFWPDGIPRTDDVENLIKVYEWMGFKKCDSAGVEAGFEKIAVYGDRAAFTHAARQIEGGKWTSKLGPYEDIEHDTLDGLAGSQYGQVIQLLKRAKKP